MREVEGGDKSRCGRRRGAQLLFPRCRSHGPGFRVEEHLS